MKVAICVSGIPRGVYCNDFLERIGSWYETVVFLNYWEHDPKIIEHQYNGGASGKRAMPFHPSRYKSPLYEYYYTSQPFAPMIPTFAEMYKQIKPEAHSRDDLGIFGMTYSILKAHEMRVEYEKKHNMKFDCVMRARFESGFRYTEGERSILDLYNYDMRYIWTPDINVNITCGMNDQSAFSNGDNMAIYMTMYNRIIPLSNRYFHSPEWMAHFNIEGLTRHVQGVIG